VSSQPPGGRFIFLVLRIMGVFRELGEQLGGGIQV